MGDWSGQTKLDEWGRSGMYPQHSHPCSPAQFFDSVIGFILEVSLKAALIEITGLFKMGQDEKSRRITAI